MRTRKTLTYVGCVAALVGCAYIGLPYVNHWELTGRFFPIDIVEKLDSPIRVNGWSEEGLSLADGRLLQLSGFRKLPKTSAGLEAVLKHGIEIDSKGAVFGLVRVHHWCGNDPTGKHIAKVNLEHLLIFLQEGELAGTLTGDEKQFLPAHRQDSFTQWGWDVSEWARFKGWSAFCTELSDELVHQGNSASSQ